MREKSLSQSELARRIGVSQASIYRLAKGDAYGSKHLHRIARELGTSAAYLVGETDDPDEDAPPAPELTFDERDLVDCFRVLTPADRSALLHIARSMAGRVDAPTTFHTDGKEYHGPPRELAAA